jgi:sigma-E factor negative regulatory protein RseA
MVMKQEISALMDGELDARTADALIQKVGLEEQECWEAYHLIGDALRQTCTHRTGLQAKIYARLVEEPTVLAPKSRGNWSIGHGLRMGIAVAASVAAVSMVAWIASRDESPSFNTARNTLGQFSPASQPSLAPTAVAEMDEYLQAHQEYSPSVLGYQRATMRTGAGAAGR